MQRTSQENKHSRCPELHLHSLENSIFQHLRDHGVNKNVIIIIIMCKYYFGYVGIQSVKNTESVIEKLHKSVATIYLANSGHNGLSSIV